MEDRGAGMRLRSFTHSQGVHLPRLEELRVTGEGYDRPLCAPSWISPNLRSLRCSGYSLSPFGCRIFISDDYLFITTPPSVWELFRLGQRGARIARLKLDAKRHQRRARVAQCHVYRIGKVRNIYTIRLPPSVTLVPSSDFGGQYVGGSQELYTIVSSGSAYASCGGPVRLRRRLGHGGESESDCAEFLAELSSAVLPSIHLADPSARLSNLNFELTYDPNGGYFPSNPGPCTPLKSIPIVFSHSPR